MGLQSSNAELLRENTASSSEPQHWSKAMFKGGAGFMMKFRYFSSGFIREKTNGDHKKPISHE